eukprot:jgi/Psemu1/28373/gm1.28373_g
MLGAVLVVEPQGDRPLHPPTEGRTHSLLLINQWPPHILPELFAVFKKESDSLLCKGLKNSNILTWARFLWLRDFDGLTYRDRNEYKHQQLPRYMHQELHLLLVVTFSAQLKDQGKDSKDHILYTKEAFECYSNSVLASVIDSTVKRFSSQDSQGYVSTAKSSDRLRYDESCAKIQR